MSQEIPQLFLIPTVLAEGTNTQVLPLEVSTTIKRLNVFFVENVRTARRFISSLKLGKHIDDITFYELHKGTPPHITREQLKGLKESAGVLSEAGCPGIADPGAVAVAIAHEMNYRVIPIVGPSSIFLALMGSGFSGQSFVFHGYLPIDKAERRRAIQQLEKNVQQSGQTQIFMETPFRNNQFLTAILETCSGNTRLCIACNLTSPNELLVTKTIQQWRQAPPDLHKLPTMFLIGI